MCFLEGFCTIRSIATHLLLSNATPSSTLFRVFVITVQIHTYVLIIQCISAWTQHGPRSICPPPPQLSSISISKLASASDVNSIVRCLCYYTSWLSRIVALRRCAAPLLMTTNAIDSKQLPFPRQRRAATSAGKQVVWSLMTVDRAVDRQLDMSNL